MAELLRENPLPLYHQIANILRSRIDLRELEPGHRLPSEGALAGTFGVSAMTVRQALTLLVQEGYLRRRQGMGTFVESQLETADRVRLTVPFSEVVAATGDLEVRLVDAELVRGPRSILETLKVAPGETALRIRRVRFSRERPMSYSIAYVPGSMGQQLTPEDLGCSMLTKALEARTGACFRGANQTIEASVADAEAATLLEVPVGSPVLLVQRAFELRGGRIGYVAINRYPSHLFRYEIRLTRQTAEGQDWQVSTHS